MADEEQTITLRDDFYRDSFGKVVFIIISLCLALGVLIATSIYLYVTIPPPVTFVVGDNWRVLPLVPLEKPYLSRPNLVQWVNDTLPKSFTFDFLHYNDQLQALRPYFTDNGWTVFTGQLNNYVNYQTVTSNKEFVTSFSAQAPTVINEGVLSGRYAWWLDAPISITTYNIGRSNTQTLDLQVLVVRVSTIDNLSGVAIDNIIVGKNSGTNTTAGTNS